MAIALLRRTGQTRLRSRGRPRRRGRAGRSGGPPARGGPPHPAVAAAARVRVLDEPPVLGAALLGLENLGLASGKLADAERRLRNDVQGVAFAAVEAGSDRRSR